MALMDNIKKFTDKANTVLNETLDLNDKQDLLMQSDLFDKLDENLVGYTYERFAVEVEQGDKDELLAFLSDYYAEIDELVAEPFTYKLTPNQLYVLHLDYLANYIVYILKNRIYDDDGDILHNISINVSSYKNYYKTYAGDGYTLLLQILGNHELGNLALVPSHFRDLDKLTHHGGKQVISTYQKLIMQYHSYMGYVLSFEDARENKDLRYYSMYKDTGVLKRDTDDRIQLQSERVIKIPVAYTADYKNLCCASCASKRMNKNKEIFNQVDLEVEKKKDITKVHFCSDCSTVLI